MCITWITGAGTVLNKWWFVVCSIVAGVVKVKCSLYGACVAPACGVVRTSKGRFASFKWLSKLANVRPGYPFSIETIDGICMFSCPLASISRGKKLTNVSPLKSGGLSNRSTETKPPCVTPDAHWPADSFAHTTVASLMFFYSQAFR